MTSPEISVIIPVYNNVGQIASAVASISSEYSLELIVVDGGSTDGTLEWLQNCKKVSHLISEPDNGVYDAMNKGIDKSSGTWLYFMGADDQLVAGAIDELLTHQRESVKIIYGAIENEGVEHRAVPVHMQSRFDGSLKWRNSLHHQAAIYHRSIFAEYRYNPKFKILADYHLNLKCWLERVGAVATTVDVARCDASGLSKSFPPALYKEELAMKSTLMSGGQMLTQKVWVWCKYLYKKILA
jgi:putative colanic acid biosynthesis glycosyltransferase